MQLLTKQSLAKQPVTMASRWKSLKQIPHYASVAVCHIINRCIMTNKFPEYLKTTKILPILKQGKDPRSPESWVGGWLAGWSAQV